MENRIDIELIEGQAFRMGNSADVKDLITRYADTAEECECFSF